VVETNNSSDEFVFLTPDGYRSQVPSSDPTVADEIRGQTGNFWDFLDNNFFVYNKVRDDYIFRADFKSDPGTVIVSPQPTAPVNPEEVTKKKDQIIESLFTTSTSVLVDPITGEITETETRAQVSVTFTDHYMNISVPVVEAEIQDLNLPIKPLIYSSRSEYNFYIRQYEQIVSSGNISENILPNLYCLEFYSLQENQEKQTDSWKNISINGSIPDRFYKVTALSPVVSGDYFNELPKTYIDITNDATIASSINLKFKNIIFSHKDVGLINQLQEKKELFPLFNEIRFSTEPSGEILNILEESNTLDTLIYSYAASQEEAGILPSQPLPFSIFNKPVIGENSFTERTAINIYDPFKNIENQYFLFTEENEIIADNDAEPLIAYVNIDGKSPEEKFDFDSLSSVEKFKTNILNVVAKTKLKNFFKTKDRTLEEIFNGKPAYNETLFYKISKFSSTIETNFQGTLIQNVYIPNSSKVDVLNYIDTQVKYDKEYSYTISAIKVVTGNQYKYSNLRESKYIADMFLADYEVMQSVKLFEVPIVANIQSRIIDSPPIFPNVDIVPFVNGSNNIRINLSNNTGEYYLKPVIIDPSEEIEFDKVRQSQKIPAPEPILFKNDDLPASFEIRRLNTPPRSYSDFVNAVVSSISTTYQSGADPKNKIITDSVSFIDVLQVNTNYYYTFRMTDTHGHISYPSPVYRVKLIESTPGFIYPEIATYEFQDLKMFNTTFPFRKYLCIKPSLSQVVLDNQDDIPSKVDEFSVSTAKIGSREEGLVGKKFKMRIVSKSSNKKMDFNFQFGRVNTENQ